MSDSTPESVAPLDAYATAKPDEPTWTVQGGDPLGGPLLEVWAAFARVLAGAISPEAASGHLDKLTHAALQNTPDSERDRQALLLRATETEKVAWQMNRYFRGGSDAEGPKLAAENTPDEEARLDLWDVRTRGVSILNNMIGDLGVLQQSLTKKGFDNEEALQSLSAIAQALGLVRDLIEHRRLFKKG